MSEKPEASEVAYEIETHVLFGSGSTISRTLLEKAARLLRRQHAEIERLHDELRQSSIDITRAEVERLREALAWAYNLRHLRGHSDPVVIPERFAPLIEVALRRED